jgi:hypothetical protein
MVEPEVEPGDQQRPRAARASALVARSAPVQITLLTFYSLPLLLSLIGAVTSRGFLDQSSFLTLALQITTQYIESLRESFATFVIPFVTAYAAAGARREEAGGLGSNALFFVIASLLLVSIFLLGLLNVRSEDFFQIFELKPEAVKTLYDREKALLAAYTKELLVYISLLIGVEVRKAV